MIAALVKAATARGMDTDVIGFTTGYRALVRKGIAAQPVTALLDPAEDAEWLNAADPFIEGHIHPDIEPEETRAYFALGLRDLAADLGREAAIDRVRAEGRKAFEPVGVMRRYIARTRPDIVITTNSPRFETALVKAAGHEGIPAVAVGDLFMVQERDWMLDPDYRAHLAVLSGSVARSMASAGYPADRIRVTGNPAFDTLVPRPDDAARRTALRAGLGLSDKTVILWPANGTPVAMDGQRFATMAEVASVFEPLCAADPRLAYVVRAHPNMPVTLPEGVHHGQLDAGNVTPEEALLIADIVCVEVSTMGVQAALRGMPVICIGFAEYAEYPKHGMAVAVDTLSEAADLIRQDKIALPEDLDMPPLGTATSNVISLAEDLLRDNADGDLACTS